MSEGLDRRSLLKALGGSAVLGCGLLGFAGCRARAPLDEALAGCIADREAARVVGEAVLLASGPLRPSAAQLVDQLARAAREEWTERAARDPAELFALVHAQHLADFDAGRLLRVRGWLLSETEAQLCALVARRAGAEA